MTAALERGEWPAARTGRYLHPGKTRYPFYRGLGGPQGRSGQAENLVPTGIRSRTVQPVVIRYTYWATGPTDNICTFEKWRNECVYFNPKSLKKPNKNRIIRGAYQSTGCQISCPGKYTSGTNRTRNADTQVFLSVKWYMKASPSGSRKIHPMKYWPFEL